MTYRVPIDPAHEAIDLAAQGVDDDTALPRIAGRGAGDKFIARAVLPRLGDAPGVYADGPVNRILRKSVEWVANLHT